MYDFLAAEKIWHSVRYRGDSQLSDDMLLEIISTQKRAWQSIKSMCIVCGETDVLHENSRPAQTNERGVEYDWLISLHNSPLIGHECRVLTVGTQFIGWCASHCLTPTSVAPKPSLHTTVAYMFFTSHLNNGCDFAA